jgi:hypothetical protein
MLMDLYPLLIFLHVLAAVGLFASLGIEVVALGRLRSAATLDAARMWIGLLRTPLPLVSMLTILVTGIWMSIVRWGDQAWIGASLLAIVGMAIVGAVATRRLRRMSTALTGESGPGLSPTFRALQSSASLVASLRLRVGIGIGILGLMTIKPDALGSIAILAAAVGAGLVAGLPLAWRRDLPSEARQQPTRST